MPITPGKIQGTWRAYYYESTLQKQVWVPLKVTREWDGLERPAAETRFKEWVEKAGIKQVRSRRKSVSSDLEQLLTAYATYLKDMRGAERTTTRRDEETRLRTYAVEYFVRKMSAGSVEYWWRYTQTYGSWLRKTYPTLNILTVKKLCQAVRRFGEFLAGRGTIPQPWLVPAPRTKRHSKTPLPRRLTPEEVIGAAKGLHEAGESQWALFVTLTYFASLRPEETYALELGDFLTGDVARKETHTYDRLKKIGLGSGLSVHISKTHIGLAPQSYTKTHYAAGVANVWDVTAAKFIASILSSHPGGRLFPGKRNSLNSGYRRIVKPLLGVNAKDLQRASGLHLGRTVGLDPILLKDVFRHSVITTSMLYTRRPGDEVELAANQNFGDVG